MAVNSSTVGPGAPNWFSISSAARATGDHFVLASASVVRQELDQEKGIRYLKTLPGLVRGSGILKPLMGLRWMTDPRTPALQDGGSFAS